MQTVFFFGLFPMCATRTGGRGSTVPSGSVCLPKSASRHWPPNLSTSCRKKTYDGIIQFNAMMEIYNYQQF